jgi:GMP reductase
MRINECIKLDFDDVLICPKRSEAPSRKTVELIRTFECLHGGILTCLPIIASNMYATGTIKMAKAFAEHKALVCLHKFHNEHELTKFWAKNQSIDLQPKFLNAFYTLGIKDDDFKRLCKFLPNWCLTSHAINCSPMLCLDAANGYTMYFVERLQQLRTRYPNAIIMAGNVVTPEMVQELLIMGADIVKVGIGPGSVCTTRIETGVGYPQLSAIIECADAAHGLGGLVCADGGCTTPGDVAKAFAGGADFVMLGGMLAGCDECDGKWVNNEFEFYGMASKEAQSKFYGGVPDYCTAEGKCVPVPKKGPAENVLKRITGGLRSTCAYVGAKRLKDLTKCTTFVRVNRIHS